ncbi:FecCD family ABC transporter permease [Dietzia cinnamea]|uniref:FecCD family ABC transporter permease n=1 Tax=Dietzia cinnamea TaxID=321318 RepID=UPI0021A518FB|nr:iron ABC transporter permease [Dietzia cinnamea]MCT2139744.1 iron ABC transporter permease [Dietzia cinnamea]
MGSGIDLAEHTARTARADMAPPSPAPATRGGRGAGEFRETPQGPGPALAVGHRRAVVFALLLAGVLSAVVLGVTLGPVPVPPGETLRVLLGGQAEDPRMQVIIESLRLPRVLTAVAAGAALGVAGLQMQTLFRNSLAEPYVLGVSSGASLGVALVVIVGAGAGAGFTAGLAGQGRIGVVIAAALGSAIVLSLVLMLSRWVRSSATLLLIGVMVGSASTAFVSVLLAYSDPELVQQYLVWGMGSFAATSWSDLRLFLPIIAAALLLSVTTIRALNALLLGEGYARTMGIDVRRARFLTLVSASVAAGVTTAFCGPIAFIGLAVPHLARVAFGTSDHRVLLPGVVLLGASVAVVCGIVSQVPGSDAILPVNAVTAAVGAPVVITVLLRSRRGSGIER